MTSKVLQAPIPSQTVDSINQLISPKVAQDSKYVGALFLFLAVCDLSIGLGTEIAGGGGMNAPNPHYPL